MQLTPKEIERIITYEVEVDCYDDHEVNMGWYIFLTENLKYPFSAEYQINKVDGKSFWKKVIVVASEAKEEDFNRYEFYVLIEVNEILIPARLSNLKFIKADDETLRTLQIWEYGKRK